MLKGTKLLYLTIVALIIESSMILYWLMKSTHRPAMTEFLRQASHRRGYFTAKDPEEDCQYSSISTVIDNVRHISSCVNKEGQNNVTKHEILTQTIEYLNDLKFTQLLGSSVRNQMPYCQEVYAGAMSDYPNYLHNWKTLNCSNSKAVATLVTVCLMYFNVRNKEDFESAAKAVKLLQKKHPKISVIIATDDRRFEALVQSTTVVKYYTATQNRLYIWKELVSYVKTHYVFIGRSFTGLGFYSDLHRAINMLSAFSKLAVISFGNINQDRVWNIDCYQVSLVNYELKLVEGYRHSFNECTVCDFVSGPFIASTDTIKEIQLDTEMENEDLGFLAFFLQLNIKRLLIISCPDIMVAVRESNSIFSVNRKRWIPFVKKWQLNQVRLSTGVIHRFDCIETNIFCKLTAFTDKGLNVPTCCLRAMSKMVIDFLKFCYKHGMHCELDTGSVLAAVKLHRPMPWDIDSDGGFHQDNLTVLKNHVSELEKNGYVVEINRGGKSVMLFYKDSHLKGLFLDLYTYSDSISIGNVHTGVYVPTKVVYGGFLVNVPYNPGLFVRNRYGSELYKHSPGWSSLKNINSFVDYHGGHFIPCAVPGHHACMDQLEPDGNLNFGTL